MLRKIACGLMVVALILCIRVVWAAGAGDEDIASEVRAGLKTLDTNNDHSAASRIVLAKLAVNAATAKTAKDPAGAQDCWEAARDALAAAARLDPANKEVSEMMVVVQKHIAPAKPATNPVNPPPATKPGPDTKPADVPVTAKRMVSPAEINRIRQIEWRHDESPSPGIRVDPETRKKFLAASPDIMPGEFNALKQEAQAAVILDSGKSEFYPGVHIARDPASIREFKINVEKVVEQNCATCHSGPKAGTFKLFNDKNPDATAYSNFLILQHYSTAVNGAVRLMVDRTTPESSLLLSFMLPPDISDAPHPTSPNFKPPVKVKTDPRYMLILKWLKSLDTLAPNYGIDLSADEPVPAAAPKSDSKLMPPAALLIIAVSITFAASVAERIWMRHHRQRLRKLAAEWQMTYSPHDQFRLTPRVFANFPVPGAAKVRVVDVLYYIDRDLYRYIFTAEYTAGVVTGKRRMRRAGSLSEPRDRGNDAPPSQITLAPAHLPLMEQYEKLRP